MTRVASYHGTDRIGLALAICLVASLVELGTAATICANWCESNVVKYSVAVGAVSSFFILLAFLMLYLNHGFMSRMHVLLAIFLVCWWAVAAAILTGTQMGIFMSAHNGYFSTWIALFAAVTYAWYVLPLPKGVLVGAGGTTTGHYTTATNPV